MRVKISPELQSDGFNLKNLSVELIPEVPSSDRAFLTINELEAMRVHRVAVPASKHALEIICGASCEIGAH